MYIHTCERYENDVKFRSCLIKQDFTGEFMFTRLQYFKITKTKKFANYINSFVKFFKQSPEIGFLYC